MRVVECPYCGDVQQGPNDAELTSCLVRHLEEAHGRDSAEDEAAGCVQEQAYEATDS